MLFYWKYWTWTLQNHTKLLIVGGIIIGVSLGLFFFSYQFYAIPTAYTPATIQVVSQASPLTLITNLEKGQETSILAKDVLSKGILLNAEIKDPDGSVVFNENFDDKILTSFTPSISGSYTFVVIPLSSESTTIEGALGNPFVVDRLDNAKRPGDIFGPEFELFAYAGLGLFMGIIVVIIGGIQTIRFKIKSKRSFTKK